MMASMADPPAKALAPRTLVAEREKVVARLSDAFAHDRLNIEEFERRLTLAHERDTLAAITNWWTIWRSQRGKFARRLWPTPVMHASMRKSPPFSAAASSLDRNPCPADSRSGRYSVARRWICAMPYSPTVSLTWKSKPCLAACRSSCPQPWQWSATEWRSSAASKASTARLRVPTRRRHCCECGTRGVRRRADRDTPARRGTARAPSPRRPPRPSRRAPRAAEQVDSHHPKQLFARSAHKNAFDAPGPIP